MRVDKAVGASPILLPDVRIPQTRAAKEGSRTGNQAEILARGGGFRETDHTATSRREPSSQNDQNDDTDETDKIDEIPKFQTATPTHTPRTSTTNPSPDPAPEREAGQSGQTSARERLGAIATAAGIYPRIASQPVPEREADRTSLFGIAARPAPTGEGGLDDSPQKGIRRYSQKSETGPPKEEHASGQGPEAQRRTIQTTTQTLNPSANVPSREEGSTRK